MTTMNYKNEFCRRAAANAEATLHAYFNEGKPEKSLAYFSRECSSWIGWGEAEIYPTYNDVFNTFTKRIDEIGSHLVSDMQSQIVYAGEGFCLIIVTCVITSAPQTGCCFSEHARFTFAMRDEGGEAKIVHLHSSAAWNQINTDELFPLEHGQKYFLEFEKQINASSLAAFIATSTPNGLKCCLAEKCYPAIFVNKALYTLAGYGSMAEMLATTRGEIKNMVYAADLARVTGAMAAHCGGGPYTINYRLLRADGSAVWVLERGIFEAGGDGSGYYICSIAPLLPEQNEFNYGALINYEEIKNSPIPMDLYFKTALELIETETPQTALEKILKLCCGMAQISGAFIKNISQSGEYMPVTAKYFNGSDEFVKLLKCTPEDIVNRFNTHGLNQCSDTALLPPEYKRKLDALNVKAYLSKTIGSANAKNADFVLTFVRLGTPHLWTDSEKDLITQTARLTALVLKQNS